MNSTTASRRKGKEPLDAPEMAVTAESRKHDQRRRVVSDEGLVEDYENWGNLEQVSDMELRNDDDDEKEENALTVLLLRSEEPELSEEQLRINDQAQEDELLAMESIYGDNVLILDRKNGLRYFEVHIDFEPKDVSVSASPAVHETEDDQSDFPYSFNEITLGPYSGRHERDSRAISRSIIPEVDIQSIKSYNYEKLSEKFTTSIHECCICYSEFPGTGFARLPCQHFFCLTCMQTYSDKHMKEGTVHKLICPDAKCGGMIPPGLLRRLLSNEDFERWESMMLQKTLESMSDVTYCPRCETICIQDENNHAQCSECFFSFCTECGDRRHVGGPCTSIAGKLRRLKEEMRNSSHSKSDRRKQREQEMMNQILSLREIYKSTKRCPRCNMAISRTQGCNHMECRNCGVHFCYRCNEMISGYDHFKAGGCTVFPDPEELEGIDEGMSDRQIDAEMQVHTRPNNVAECPTCHQPNFKEGTNNLIFCWACRDPFWFLCNKTARRSYRHFGRRGGCKQYTKD